MVLLYLSKQLGLIDFFKLFWGLNLDILVQAQAQAWLCLIFGLKLQTLIQAFTNFVCMSDIYTSVQTYFFDNFKSLKLEPQNQAQTWLLIMQSLKRLKLEIIKLFAYLVCSIGGGDIEFIKLSSYKYSCTFIEKW